jgi:hypothetical protein
MGGLGLTSHKLIAPLAAQAANEGADQYLQRLSFLPTPNPAPQRPPAKQRDLSNEAHTKTLNTLLESLPLEEAIAVVDNGNPTGCKWLATVPTHTSYTLTNHEFATALQARLLLTPNPTCTNCNSPCSIGHLTNICNHTQHARPHDIIKTAAANLIKSAGKGIRVSIEPKVGNRRNDIRVEGCPALGIAPHDIEIKAFSPLAGKTVDIIRKTLGSNPTTAANVHNAMEAAYDTHLLKVDVPSVSWSSPTPSRTFVHSLLFPPPT